MAFWLMLPRFPTGLMPGCFGSGRMDHDGGVLEWYLHMLKEVESMIQKEGVANIRSDQTIPEGKVQNFISVLSVHCWKWIVLPTAMDKWHQQTLYLMKNYRNDEDRISWMHSGPSYLIGRKQSYSTLPEPSLWPKGEISRYTIRRSQQLLVFGH